MKTKKVIILLSLLVILLSFTAMTASAQEAQEAPVVRAILFYSPYCQHCEYVINTILPPLFDEYGDQLYILGVDVSQEWGSMLYNETLTAMAYPPEQSGVPFMVVGDTILIGSQQIPQEFPTIIAEGLAGDGVAWPEVDAIHNFLLEQGLIDDQGADIYPPPAAEQPAEADNTPSEDVPEPTATEEPAAPSVSDEANASGEITVFDETSTGKNTFGENFNRDRIANTLAIIVLIVMVVVVVWIGIQFMQANTLKTWPTWVLPVLLVIGFAIATYLATVEVSGNEAICGPVGDCNAVQQSEYATLFGFLPVAIFGMIGYVMIGGSWLTARLTEGKVRFFATMAMFLSGLFGLIFFIYLTFLEPFVIGATCAWCLSSAIIMTLINLYTTPLALQAWADMDVDDYLDDEA